MEKLCPLLILIGLMGTNGIRITLLAADELPTFVTTSSPDVTDSTPVTVPNTKDPTKSPIINNGSEGGVVFPDEDKTYDPNLRPIPTKPSWPIPIPTNLTPIPTATPEPTPAVTSEITRPTPEPTVPITPIDDIVAEKQPVGTNPNGYSINPFEAIEQCIRSCKITYEYSPVCGTDGRTYTNIRQLYCAKKCGIYVNPQVRGPCDSSTPTPPTPAPVTSSTLEVTTQSAAIKQCIRNCRVSAEYNPVCGSDGATYTNPGRLLCAKYCGVVVDMRARGPCATTPLPTLPPTEPTTLAPDVTQCLVRNCPSTQEYNPVCGSDGVTYSNPRRMYCARRCGVNVSFISMGFCLPSTTSSTTATTFTEPQKAPEIPTTTESDLVKECSRSCPTSTEYDPVCGSNGATYMNYGSLICAHICGVDVVLRGKGPCLGEITPPATVATTIIPTTTESDLVKECSRSCPTSTEYNPVCGSNGATYMNYGSLICAHICGVDVVLRGKGPCLGEITPPATVATTIIPTTTESDLVKECSRSCPTSTEYNPVCGSNGATYMNYGSLICAQICGVDVVLRGKGPCLGEITPPATVATTIGTSPAYDVVRCVAECPVPPESNPVCGSNGVTYQNVPHLYCAIICGVDVELGHSGSCVDSSTDGSVDADPSSSLRIKACIHNCPTATREYNPVCGSNDVTYNNLSLLKCAASCGLNVSLARNSKCPKDILRRLGAGK